MPEERTGSRRTEVCPACGDDMGLPDDIVLGEVVWCFSCGIELEVVSLEPVRIELFEEEEK
jgi:alpha-aminoadipate carrier protein LysW